VRYRQRIEAGLASINGIAIDSLDEAVQLGRKMIEFRAGFTADAIRDVVSN
jgi:creatinine amidohydrolase